jgi:DNA replication protein DnaC
MLNEPTREKLITMRLGALLEAWGQQTKDIEVQKLSFDERLGMLVDAEWMDRENRRLVRTLHAAKLRQQNACMEDIEASPQRGLERNMVRDLMGCGWVQAHQNIVITGPTGTGKTYIACALAQHACRKGYKSLYRRAVRLFDELLLARASGEYAKQLAKLMKVDVLVIDDWALTPMKEPDRQDLLEVLEDRYGVRSVIIASQLPPTHWHAYIQEPTIADAICDRVLHNAHRITLKGASRRKEGSTTE